jgi:hypothetical protein
VHQLLLLLLLLLTFKSILTLQIEEAQQMLTTVKVVPFSPLEGVTIATTEEEAKNESKSAGPADIDGQCDEILDQLPSLASLRQTVFTMTPFLFEKDDDAHMKVGLHY